MPSQDQRASREALEIERRLARLTEQCAGLLDRWAVDHERTRNDQAARMQELQDAIRHEWTALREVHEAPVKQLREQASTLAEISAATATQALSGFERAEARLAALESNLLQRVNELADGMQPALDQVRALERPEAPPSPAAPVAPAPQDVARALPHEESNVLLQRLQTLEREVSDGQVRLLEATARTNRVRRIAWIAVAAILVASVVAGVWGNRILQQIAGANARVTEAERRAAAAVTTSQQVETARSEVDRQLDEARSAGLKAQRVSDVLAAPDLVRYTVVGGDATTRYNAQALWSRSRGVVFSGSRLPQPPQGAVYQIWLLTRAEAVSAGMFVPDPTGRFTFVTDAPVSVPRPVAGVSITIEPAGGSEAPTGLTVLAPPQ